MPGADLQGPRSLNNSIRLYYKCIRILTRRIPQLPNWEPLYFLPFCEDRLRRINLEPQSCPIQAVSVYLGSINLM